MACPHCCFGCRPGIGQDMSKETFIKSCELAQNYGSGICLGGGEPTMHPLFWEFVGIALSYTGRDTEGYLWLATNGSKTQDALTLAQLTNKRVLTAVLSRDDWHDSIDSRVVEAYSALRSEGYEGIRSNERITNHGSAKKNNLATDPDMCCCNEALIMPNGKFFGCGCRRHCLGTVDDHTIPEGYDIGECIVEFQKLSPAQRAIWD